MKKILYILLVVTLVIAGCESKPYADFSMSNSAVEVGEDVYFYNHSDHAKEYAWDFGDGYFASVVNPVHFYDAPGVYEVSLAAMKEDRVDIIYRTIEVLPPTVLRIQVREYYDKYAVSGASVILYPTLYDWEQQTNMVLEVFTDEYGVAEIYDLEPAVYYVDVFHTTHNNYALADEDINFIKISGLEYNTTSYFTAWVDYVESSLRSQQDRVRTKSINTEKRKYDSLR